MMGLVMLKQAPRDPAMQQIRFCEVELDHCQDHHEHEEEAEEE